MSGLVDLRSDTVTRPTPEMRRAMADAEVGDDQYGEDPTVNKLEAIFAARVGMEAALYVASGTMANQVALRVLARPGTTVLAGKRSHLVAYENGAAGMNATAQMQPVGDDAGFPDPVEIEWARRGPEHHLPTPGLVSIENTHMAAGGRVVLPEEMKALRVACGDLAIHVDGARIFNAEVASGASAAVLVEGAATMMACLSKGLGAPVGSVLAGAADVIEAARVERHRLGGAMRQAGVIAAAGVVALRSMVDRLADDHGRARRLATAVAERWPGGLDPATVTTNIVVFTHPRPAELLDHLRRAGVLGGTIAPRTVRFVTHFDVDEAGIDQAIGALRDAPG